MSDKLKKMFSPTEFSRLTRRVRVVANEAFAYQTRRLTLEAPEFVSRVEPGQFVMLRLPDISDPLLGRPLAVYRGSAKDGSIELIYQIVGKMTRRLAEVASGDELEMTGPLGNGWRVIEEGGVPRFEHLIMVAGGIGQTPFYPLAEKYGVRTPPTKMTLLYGARNAERLVPLDDFSRLGVEIFTATEDGSAGRRGYVTELIPDVFARSGVTAEKTAVCACGPRPMLAAAYRAAKKIGLRCWTSLESPMSCGMGICYGCAVEYLGDDGVWDYRRTCLDGPVFDAAHLKWEE